MIRVLVADDQRLVREGFAAILGAQDDLDVVGLAANGAEALRLVREATPDVVLMDIRMPTLDGIEAARRIAATPKPPKILMLTTFDLDEHVYDALQAGASGFLLKDVPSGRLADAIRAVAAGDMLLDPTLTRRLVERYAHRPPPATGRIPERLRILSSRELEVMREIAQGLSNAEVAERLHLSAATVKTHVAALLRKLDLRDRIQIVICAYESGLIEPGTESS